MVVVSEVVVTLLVVIRGGDGGCGGDCGSGVCHHGKETPWSDLEGTAS